MGDLKQEQEQEQEHVYDNVVNKLEKQPFLLYSVSGLITYIISLPFDDDKTDPYIFLLYFVITVPIVMQFYIEILKLRLEKKVIIQKKISSAWGSFWEFAGGLLFIVVVLFALSEYSDDRTQNNENKIPDLKQSENTNKPDVKGSPKKQEESQQPLKNDGNKNKGLSVN